MRPTPLKLALALGLTGAGVSLGGCHTTGTDLVSKAASLEPNTATALFAANVGFNTINAIQYNIALSQAQARIQELQPESQRARALELVTRLSDGSRHLDDLTPADKQLLAKVIAITQPEEDRR